jgi:hypothetical protein
LLSKREQQSQDENPTGAVSWRIFITWILFIIGIHTTAVATLLFWILIYDPSDTTIMFPTIIAHGGLFVLLTLDGLLLNRIPIRVMHWIGILVPFDLTFIGWSIIHDLGTNMGNPDNNDTDISTNDDAIYQGVLEWDANPTTAIKWTIICVFVLGLLLFALILTLSTNIFGDRLRYQNEIKNTFHVPSKIFCIDNDEEEPTSQELTVHVAA